MSRDTQDNEKYSVKHLLFYRAIPPYVIKFPTNHYKVYGCIDCGDRFILESSYEDHINRKSLKISYTCRRCSGPSQQKIFYNRCNFLSHIRSHSFKTASINVSDLKIEPLPISFFKFNILKSVSSETRRQSQLQQQQIQATPTENNSEITRTICVECNIDITLKGSPSEDRVSHYMKYSNGFHTCPVCLLTLPTICALKSHLRFHLKYPPYFCPECGILLSDQVINYPFNHYCEGFNMIRATVRLKCPLPNCHSSLFHPNDFKKHMKLDHMKKVYKCSYCVVACFSEATLSKHLESHKPEQLLPKLNSMLIFYQCEMCPGRLVLQNHFESHVNAHISDNVYPCWTCGSRFNNIPLLIEHHLKHHITSDNALKEALQMALKKCDVRKYVKKKMFRVVKRCEQCLRSFSYKCVYDAIKGLPNACPYKCTPASNSLLKSQSTPITCPLCPSKIPQQWENVKRHFALDHKNHKCLDCKVTIKKLDIGKIRKKRNRKRNNVTSTKTRRVKKCTKDILDSNKNTLGEDTTKPYSNLICVKCQRECETKEDLEEHIKDHRDPYMAYQCMECGECFVVKPSFSTHLLIKHGISGVDDYIEKKKHCYNDNALIICQETDSDSMPLEENQCKICRERFGDSEELEKHFRVHGMAFLIKNAQNKTG